MSLLPSGGPPWFRLWIVRCDGNWRPATWSDVPPQATAIEPAADELYSAADAALYLFGFNREAVGTTPLMWAVAVPVALRFEGDAAVGECVQGFLFPPDVSAQVDRGGVELARS